MHGRTELLVKGKLEQHDWSERLSSGFGVAIKRMTNDVRLQILADFFFDSGLAVAIQQCGYFKNGNQWKTSMCKRQMAL